MNKSIFLSLKNWACWCFYASFAVLLYVHFYGVVYTDYALAGVASILFVRARNESSLQMLCLSVFFASIFGIITYYYDQNSLFTMKEKLSGELYYGICFVISMSPLIYSFIKTSDLSVKIGIAAIGLALSPSLLYGFTSQHLLDINPMFFSLAIMGFFLVSALDTNVKTTRNVSIIAGLGGTAMVLYNIKNIMFQVCDKPELNSWYSWIDYDKEKYPVFSFCNDYSHEFRWMLLISCFSMLIYFVYLFKYSNYTLKAICIPAIIAFFLLGLYSLGMYLSFDFDLIIFINMVVYMLFAFSFYKLNKKL